MKWPLVIPLVLFSGHAARSQTSRPDWLDDAGKFCKELAARTNRRSPGQPIRNTEPPRFTAYPVQPVVTPRNKPATIDKDLDDADFKIAVKQEAAKGPDFAGRYAVVLWTCGSWCSNAIIADFITGTTHELPFLGVVGCSKLTRDHETIERRADSRLLVVRGSLEMTDGHALENGPCGAFSFVWQRDRLRLLSCRISTTP